MKQGSTLFLKLVVALIAAGVLAICIFGLPQLIATDRTGLYAPILIALYIPAIPFFFALAQAIKLLNYIDRNKVFSEASIHSIKLIKFCAAIISGLFIAGMPYIFIAGDKDDAPGVILIALVIIFASTVIATASAVLQRLLRNVVEMKSENDLTV